MTHYYHISNYLVLYKSKHIVDPNEDSYSHILLPNLSEEDASSFLADPVKYVEANDYPFPEDIVEFQNKEWEIVNSLEDALFLNPHELLQSQQHEDSKMRPVFDGTNEDECEAWDELQESTHRP